MREWKLTQAINEGVLRLRVDDIVCCNISAYPHLTSVLLTDSCVYCTRPMAVRSPMPLSAEWGNCVGETAKAVFVHLL